MQAECLAGIGPVLYILDFVKKQKTLTRTVRLFYIGKKLIATRYSRQSAAVFKIQEDDIVRFFANFFGNLRKNDGLATSADAGNNLDEVAIVKLPNRSDVFFTLNHSPPSTELFCKYNKKFSI